MAKKNYIKYWFKDFWRIASLELKQIFSDSGVLLIFLVAGIAYPLLYNIIYLNGILNDTPVAVVDDAGCQLSRRYIREVDATRECSVEYYCANMEEAKDLMQKRKVNGIIYFPNDYQERLMRNETATISVYCDMSSFLYYKNALMAVNHVMLEEMNKIQADHFRAGGFTEQQVEEFTKFITYEENNPYNRAFSYNYFLVSVILMLIIQQTMFYGMSLLSGTMKERKNTLNAIPLHLHKNGLGRIIIGRGAAYELIYMGISIYIMTIVPAIFGIPQRGAFGDLVMLAFIFVTDCVFFSMTWSTLITRRESVFLLFLFMSPICLFLTGTSWPETAFPEFWKWFSYLFPSTFGCKAYVNISSAGGNLAVVGELIRAMTLQTIIYMVLSSIAAYVENKAHKR